jgi:hypothetical protein
MTDHYRCPVCGFLELHEPPYTPCGGSYEICPACGYQFGVSDDDLGITAEDWRAAWISSGAKWSSKGIAEPVDWDPSKLLAKLLA